MAKKIFTFPITNLPSLQEEEKRDLSSSFPTYALTLVKRWPSSGAITL